MNNQERRVVLLPDQKGQEFYADKRHAARVFDALIERLRKKGPPYHAAHVPQADQYLPSNLARGSREHAVFLFVLCLWMRGGVESDTAARFLKEMHEARPDVFEPELYWGFGSHATKKQVAAIAEVLIAHRLGQRVEVNALGWVYNMRKLARFWQSDPRELMKDGPPFKKLARRIIGKTTGSKGELINEDSPNGFMFFREKMAAMIAYFLIDSHLVPPFYAPVPVDFHVLRLLVANRIIRPKGKGDKPADAVGVDFMRNAPQRLAREVTEWYCRTRRISPVALCDALWLLSRTLCRHNPGNSGYVADARRAKASKEARAAAIDEKASAEQNGHVQPAFGFDCVSKAPAAVQAAEADEGVVAVEETEGEHPNEPTGRKRYLGLKWRPDQLERPAMAKRIAQTCGICPLKATCSYNISSGSYYTGGMLLPERLRVAPADGQIHAFDHPAFIETLHAPVAAGVRFACIDLDLKGH